MKSFSVTKSLVLGACLAVIMCGCATRPGGISASTEPIEGRKFLNLGRVQNTDSRLTLFGVIPMSGSNSIRDAVDAAIRKRGGDAMISVSVESYTQYWILFVRHVTRIDGDVIKFQNM